MELILSTVCTVNENIFDLCLYHGPRGASDVMKCSLCLLSQRTVNECLFNRNGDCDHSVCEETNVTCTDTHAHRRLCTLSHKHITTHTSTCMRAQPHMHDFTQRCPPYKTKQQTTHTQRQVKWHIVSIIDLKRKLNFTSFKNTRNTNKFRPNRGCLASLTLHVNNVSLFIVGVIG